MIKRSFPGRGNMPWRRGWGVHRSVSWNHSSGVRSLRSGAAKANSDTETKPSENNLTVFVDALCSGPVLFQDSFLIPFLYPMCSTNVECVAGLRGPVCWSRETTKGEGILPSTQLTLAIKLLSKVTFPDIHMIFRYGHQSVKMAMGRQVHFVFFTKVTKFSALCYPL